MKTLPNRFAFTSPAYKEKKSFYAVRICNDRYNLYDGDDNGCLSWYYADDIQKKIDKGEIIILVGVCVPEEIC